jgi:hypothetical protein
MIQSMVRIMVFGVWYREYGTDYGSTNKPIKQESTPYCRIINNIKMNCPIRKLYRTIYFFSEVCLSSAVSDAGGGGGGEGGGDGERRRKTDIIILFSAPWNNREPRSDQVTWLRAHKENRVRAHPRNHRAGAREQIPNLRSEGL